MSHKSVEIVECMRAAFSIIEKEKNWARHEYARTAQGSPSDPESKEACRFCSLGALHRVASDGRPEKSKRSAEEQNVINGLVDAAEEILNDAASKMTPGRGTGIVFANDHFSHARLISIWRFALNRLSPQKIISTAKKPHKGRSPSRARRKPEARTISESRRST